jgi:NAD(P)H-dependent flavin oxidoreductase YrpB (nitropropane dioxygenase family)
MKTVRTPWIGFKVLAAGAIKPQAGFRYAFENGADFIAVGMLDFFVKENVETARQVLADPIIQNRSRPWA